MPAVKQFRLPDAGEGLTEAEIVSWKVRVGDTVKVNDTIVEIETAKSLVELPCPFAGVVTELLVPKGVTVEVGTPIIAVDTDPSGAAPGGPEDGAASSVETAPVPPAGGPQPPAPGADTTAVQVPPAEGAVEPGLIGGPASGGRTAVLVGYGPRTTAAARRPRKARTSTSEAVGAPESPANRQGRRPSGTRARQAAGPGSRQAARRRPGDPHAVRSERRRDPGGRRDRGVRRRTGRGADRCLWGTGRSGTRGHGSRSKGSASSRRTRW